MRKKIDFHAVLSKCLLKQGFEISVTFFGKQEIGKVKNDITNPRKNKIFMKNLSFAYNEDGMKYSSN